MWLTWKLLTITSRWFLFYTTSLFSPLACPRSCRRVPISILLLSYFLFYRHLSYCLLFGFFQALDSVKCLETIWTIIGTMKIKLIWINFLLTCCLLVSFHSQQTESTTCRNFQGSEWTHPKGNLGNIWELWIMSEWHQQRAIEET